MPPEKENHLPDFPEFPFPRERLTGPQRQVMSALAAGYTVCRASGPMIPDASCVLIGNGTRLARITVDSLEYRELIEVASTEDDPNRRWCQIIFYRLSRRGWYEVVRQKLAFAANEVETLLPHRIAGIHAEIERYVSQYQVEPLVQVKGTRFEAYLEYRSDPSKRLLCEVTVPKWAPVVAFDEEKNALGLSQGRPEDQEQKIEWVNLRSFTTGKLRLSPPKEQATSGADS
jgi:hypothetical protein